MITDRYDHHHDIPGGAQADLLLCTDRQTGEQVVVKWYRGADGMVDPHVFQTLERADHPNVVSSRLERGDGERWEVMEYFPIGSLQKVLDERDGAPLGPAFARKFVEQMSAALDHLHGLLVVHRDLKPDNVLVRTMDPVEVAIGDFGVSIQTRGTVAASVRGTWAYAPPEASFGDVSGRGDWWSLGMMTFELLTGHHVLEDPETRVSPDARQMRLLIGRGDFELSAVEDPRWHLLLSGLLTHAQHDRWTGVQVREWLAGGSPAVIRSAPMDDTLRAVYAATAANVKPVVVAEQAYTDPAELTRALARHWDEAVRKLAGRELEDVRQLLLTMGVDQDIVTDCLSRSPSSFVLLALQGALLADEPPMFRDRPIDGQNLSQAANLAQSEDSAAAEWIRDLRGRRILGELSRYSSDSAYLAIAEERLSSWWDEVERWASSLRAIPDVAPLLAGLRDRWEGALLGAALDDSVAVGLRQRAITEARETDPVPAWAEPLRMGADALDEARAAGTGTAAVAADLLGLARNLERSRIRAVEEAERERQLERTREEQRRRAQLRGQLLGARRTYARRRFTGRLIAVGIFAALAGLLSAAPQTGLERIVASESFWPAVAIAGVAALALSIAVLAWEILVRPVRLAASGQLVAAGVVMSVTLWCIQGLSRWGSTAAFPSTETTWWIVPPVVMGGFFLTAAGLAAVFGPRVSAADEVRNVAGCWRPAPAPTAIRRLVMVLAVVVGLAGVVVAAQWLQILSVAGGAGASPLAEIDVPPWALTATDHIDEFLPNLPLPSDPGGRLLASTIIFTFGLVMTRLAGDLSRSSSALAAVAVSAALVLNVLLVGMPGELVQGITGIVLIGFGIAVAGLFVWAIVGALAA